MAQTAFPFDPSAAPIGAGLASRCLPAGQAGPAVPAGQAAGGFAAAADLDSTGFDIGFSHAQWGLTPPLAHLHADNPVRQGWQAGVAAFGPRTRTPGTAVRQWLALRLQAWQAGQAFEGVQVTPHFLSRLSAGECPVSRLPLQQPGAARAAATADAAVAADDASAPHGQVQRLNPAAAYAAGNLAVLHPLVAQARQDLDCAAVLALAERLRSGPAQTLRDLDAAAWQRLAVLLSFATPLPHGQAACLPLLVLPTRRLRVINPVQAVQVMLTLQFTTAGYARRMLGLAALLPSSEARQAYQIFMHTLLARRLAAGPQADARQLRHAIEDSWADPLVNRRWQRLAMRLTAADCERLLERAAQRGLVVGGGRWMSREQALEGWCLPTDGGQRRASAQADSAATGAGTVTGIGSGTGVAASSGQLPGASPRPAPRVQAMAEAGSLCVRPGMARNRGSQKLAS